MNILGRKVLRSAMATKIIPLPDVEKISPRVIRILGGNPGKFTLQGTNTYLVGQGAKRILIDTGEGRPEWFQSLKKVLDDEKASVEKVILTHWHGDHIGGVKHVTTLSAKPVVYKSSPDDGMLDIVDGQKFTTEGATLRAFHSPGHTTDHMALILEEEDAMFTGDNILGHGTAVFEDLPAYLNSLDRMSQQVSGRGYPGHGPVLEDCKAKAKEYISHRAQREREVVEVLARGADGEGNGLMDIVKIIYKDVPENLHIPASMGIRQILWKLQEEEKVKHSEDGDVWILQRKPSLDET